jgi:hypothetical protein
MAPSASIFIPAVIGAFLDGRGYEPVFLTSTAYSRIAYIFSEEEGAIREWDYS